MAEDWDGTSKSAQTLDGASRTLSDTYSEAFLKAFAFDPEVSDANRDVLFEFIVAGTWEKALSVLDESTETAGHQDFWTAARICIANVNDEELRHHLAGQCLIGFRHLTGDLSHAERRHLELYPKPRAQGDHSAARRVYAARETALATNDVIMEKHILRQVVSIDPCATPIWFSLAALAHQEGDTPTYRRCVQRFTLSIIAELDAGLFARRHGVHKVARSAFESCLSALSGKEMLAPTVAVSALTALAGIQADIADPEGALSYMRRACQVAEAHGSAFYASDIVRLRVSLAYMMIRTARLDEAEGLLNGVMAEISTTGSPPTPDSLGSDRSRILMGLGEIARRRGNDDRAMVLLVQGVELLGLRVASDGRLFTNGGIPWRADPSLPLAEIHAGAYPDPSPASFDPGNTWFADTYEFLVGLFRAAKGDTAHYSADLDADLLRVAMAPIHSTQRGKALSRLGTSFWHLGNLDRAEEALRGALLEFEKTEEGWSAIADSEQVLAEVLLALGRATEAIPLVNAALEHFPEAHDLDAEVIAISLAQCHFARARIRANIANSSGSFDRNDILSDASAAATLLNGVADSENAFGTLQNVAILLVALGAPQEAAELLVRAARGFLAKFPTYVDVSTPFSSPLGRTPNPQSLWLLLKLLVDNAVSHERFLPQVFTILFRAREFPVAAFRDVVRRRNQAADLSRPLIERLHTLRERLHVARLSGHADDVESLSRSERAIMAELHSVTKSSFDRAPRFNAFFQSLETSLAGDEVYVEFVSFVPLEVTIQSEMNFKEAESQTVAILCAKSGDGIATELYDLGNEKDLSALIDFLNQPYLFGARHRVEADLAIAQAIGRRFTWDSNETVVGQLRAMYRERLDTTLGRLLKRMSEFCRWNVGVRGPLAKLAFDFLPVQSDFAVKAIKITRDPILGDLPDTSPARTVRKPIIVGDPAFGKSLGALQATLETPLEPLPGAREEAKAVAELLGVQAIVGIDASRDFILGVDSPPILHLATHGFFMRPHQRIDIASALKASLDRHGQPVNATLARLYRDDPYCHIGLALAADASHWDDGSGFSQGAIFGDEIALMNLLDTDLVVLSCCDSGLGLVHNVQGAINLPRAFLSAGAKAVVASLWPLPDAFVRPVMVDFYRCILDGATVIEALTSAKRSAMTRGDPMLVWGALQIFGQGNRTVQLAK